jgi:ABC-type phosphate/phosphonate transport system substrate-binding protein
VIGIVLSWLLLSWFLRGAGPLRAASEPDAKLMHISVAQSFFRDEPESLIGPGRESIRVLMEVATGLPSEVVQPVPPALLADRLLKDELQLAAFQGVEFAWEQQKHAALRPLLIAVNQTCDRQAHLLVRNDSHAQGWSDLRGTALAIPCRSREHCHLFMGRHCRECGARAEQFFSRITKPATTEDALDDVVDGDVVATVVDTVGLKAYEQRKPGRAARLRILHSSEKFPDTVVAYHAGALSQATLERCRTGLLQADKTQRGRLLLSLWMLTHFEELPKDFDKRLANIRQAYPEPEGTGNKQMPAKQAAKR